MGQFELSVLLSISCSVVSNSLWPHGLQPARLLCPWDSPGKNTGVAAISFSNAWKWKVKVKLLSRAWLLATSWTAACQAPLSMGFSRQEYWSRVPLPSPFTPLLHEYKSFCSFGLYLMVKSIQNCHLEKRGTCLKTVGFRALSTQIQILTQLPSSWVTLGMLLTLSVPHRWYKERRYKYNASSKEPGT